MVPKPAAPEDIAMAPRSDWRWLSFMMIGCLLYKNSSDFHHTCATDPPSEEETVKRKSLTAVGCGRRGGGGNDLSCNERRS